MKSVCDKYGALFILDEVSSNLFGVESKSIKHYHYGQVMSGMGRT